MARYETNILDYIARKTKGNRGKRPFTKGELWIEPITAPMKGSVGKSRGKRKMGVRTPQGRMIFTRKKKNGCHLASNSEIRESQRPNAAGAVVAAHVWPKIPIR